MQSSQLILRENLEVVNYNTVFTYLLYNQLDKDFIRQLVDQLNKGDKLHLQWDLLQGVHGYAGYPSYFYQNMFQYISLGLNEEKQLKYYKDHIYMMYRETREKEWNASRQVYKFVDGCGVVRDQIVL